MALLQQRLPQAHDHTADPLAFGELGIVDPATVERRDHTLDPDRTEVFVHPNFDKMYAPTMGRNTAISGRQHLAKTVGGCVTISFSGARFEGVG
ncbi:hypothetical protein D3C75_1041500 [compost metagenome]